MKNEALRAAEEKRYYGKDSGETEVEGLLKRTYKLLKQLENTCHFRSALHLKGTALKNCIKANIREIADMMIAIPTYFDANSVEKMFRDVCEYIIKEEEEITIL